MCSLVQLLGASLQELRGVAQPRPSEGREVAAEAEPRGGQELPGPHPRRRLEEAGLAPSNRSPRTPPHSKNTQKLKKTRNLPTMMVDGDVF